MSIKTLHLTNYWHGQSGGIATFYRELLSAAERQKRKICLVVPGARESVENHGSYGRIYSLRGRPSRLSPGYRLLGPDQYLMPASPLRRILNQERPELVECCDRYTLNYLAALLRRGWLIRGYRPAVIGLQCERMDDNVATYVSNRPGAKAFCDWYLRWLHFPMFDHHIAVSEYVASELREIANGHDIRRGVWIRPHGVACRCFSPDLRTPESRSNLESRCGAPEGSSIVLYVGRLAPEKNLDLLIKAMDRLEQVSPGEFYLVVVGEGSLRRELQQQCERLLPGTACFLGHVAGRDELARIYANSDIFLHPNPKEPFGIAPLEAMASGLALIVPDSGGVRHYAGHDNAWLIEPDPRSFAHAAQEIRRSPSAACDRRRAARATAERLDWELVTAGYFELYDELHAMVRDSRHSPAIAPAFYSTSERSADVKGAVVA